MGGVLLANNIDDLNNGHNMIVVVVLFGFYGTICLRHSYRPIDMSESKLSFTIAA